MARRHKKRRARNKAKLGRVLALSALGLFAFAVCGSFALYIGLRAYLHSERFRGMLGERVSGVLRADGEFGDFKWTGTTAYTEDFKARGFEDAAFARVKADSIKTRVNFGAVRRGVWELADIDIDRINVLIGDDDRAAGHSPEPGEGGGGGFLGGLIPDEVEVKRIGVAELNFDLVTGGTTVSGRRSRVEVIPVSNTEVYRIGIRGGRVSAPGQLTFELDEADLRVGGGRVVIDRAALGFYDGATLDVSGDADLGEGGLAAVAVEMGVRDLPAAKVLPDDWVKRLRGTIEVDAEARGRPGEGGDLSVEGVAHLRGGVLEAVPVLERVDEMLGSSRFRRLAFSDFRVRFKRSGRVTELQDYYALSAGSACLKGRATSPDGGEPSGMYMLGVTPDTIKWLPLVKKAVIEGVFSHGRDEAFGLVFGDASTGVEKPPEGFRWAVARIVPGAPDPYTADLREQMFEAGGMALWGELVGLSKGGVEALKILADAAKTKGVDVAVVLAEGRGEQPMFSPENLMRAAGELGVTAAMDSLLKGLADSVGELPGTLMQTGASLFNGLLP